MESYRSGRNETDSKSVCPSLGTWVRIPPTPLESSHESVGFLFLGGG